MRCLIDTHILLWQLTTPARIPPHFRQRLDEADAVFVSAASFWEIAIKVSLGKLHADVDAIQANAEEAGFHELPVTARHGIRVSRLPLFHKDPFDRLLVAQALSEPLTLVTADAALRAYGPFVEVI